MGLPQTHYARSGELAIAYQVHGDGDLDLLFSGSIASNVETSWLLPEAAQLFERLGRFARVIRFDRRDSGCSDPYMADLTLEAHADDALAVMDAAGVERPVLLGALACARPPPTPPSRSPAPPLPCPRRCRPAPPGPAPPLPPPPPPRPDPP